jgi:DNA-binding NarL/FixJ family response regulator
VTVASRAVPSIGDSAKWVAAATGFETLPGLPSPRMSSDEPITIVIADDHRSFGEAMQIALDREQDLSVIEVVGDGELAVTATLENEPDVVLMDLRMPGADGLEATRRIRTQGGRSAIVILTGEDDDTTLARAIQAGARGLLPKTSAITDVATAVRRAHRGEPLHRPSDVNRVLRAERSRSERDRDLERRVQRLTPRETQILQAMADGQAPEAITQKLGMSRHTLRTHTQNILTKLGVHSKTDAVVAAIRFGKATPPGLAPPDRDTPEAAGNGGLERVV